MGRSLGDISVLAYRYALRSLVGKAQFSFELHKRIITYILKKDPSVDTIQINKIADDIIVKLTELSYINDDNLVESYIRSQLGKGFGPRNIKLKLRRKGIESDTIDNALAKLIENSNDVTQTIHHSSSSKGNANEKNNEEVDKIYNSAFDVATKYVSKRVKKVEDSKDLYKLKHNTYAMLMTRGFDAKINYKVLDAVFGELSSQDDGNDDYNE